ncbi:hypothetical protein KBY55_21555 [Streptomyces sp. b94]|uniref:hypothetical protein n=1 Tax=Streptomyces sp. b94 TaxID=1827634 RepID=UPI001B366077|nr:hypothetical protein [Streptomyces sp. b94]MBQ1098591.1 hypothetical protein [Streptomyces sp. b94]
MPASTPRPHIMALLFDTDFNRPSGTRTFRHLDGRPFTDEEQALADDATLEELQAAGVHVHNPEAGVEAQAATYQMADLLFKYVLPHREALIPFMTHEDMLEYGRLETVIAAGAHLLGPHED